MRRTQRSTSLAMVGAPRLTTARSMASMCLGSTASSASSPRCGLMSFPMRLRTMFGCFQRPLIMRSKYSSASWPDGGDAARGLDAGQGGGLALLLLTGHVVPQGDLGAEFLRGLACGGEGEMRAAADLHHSRLASEAAAQSPTGRCALLSPGQDETIAVGAALETFPGPDPGPDRHVSRLPHRHPLPCVHTAGRWALWVHACVHANSGMGWAAVQPPETLEARVNAGLSGRLGGSRDPLKPHSMFCTCARICSISTFISTETLVSSSAADFEPSVFASRCRSWIRKSSRFPTSPPASSSRAISSRCERSRASSSATSMRMA